MLEDSHESVQHEQDMRSTTDTVSALQYERLAIVFFSSSGCILRMDCDWEHETFLVLVAIGESVAPDLFYFSRWYPPMRVWSVFYEPVSNFCK